MRTFFRHPFPQSCDPASAQLPGVVFVAKPTVSLFQSACVLRHWVMLIWACWKGSASMALCALLLFSCFSRPLWQPLLKYQQVLSSRHLSREEHTPRVRRLTHFPCFQNDTGVVDACDLQQIPQLPPELSVLFRHLKWIPNSQTQNKQTTLIHPHTFFLMALMIKLRVSFMEDQQALYRQASSLALVSLF